MTASNTISESDFLNLYAGQSPEVGAAASRVYLAAAEAGDKKLVMAHAQSDAAKNLMVAAKEAVSSYEGLRNNTNTSNTALQQAMVAGTVTQGNLTAAMAQLMVYQASQESAKEYEQEIARREELARFVEAERNRLRLLLTRSKPGSRPAWIRCARGCFSESRRSTAETASRP